MLTHFEDLIYPAFTGNYIRGPKDKYPQFSFSHVQVKEILGEYVLLGNFIKNTQYKIITTMNEGELVSSPAAIPTAPYSRFIIFLKNHRMILIKNESASPDITSFQTTVRSFLGQYTSEKNKSIEDKGLKLPMACTNIVDIPLKDDIEEVLRNVKKIQWVNLRFFQLNNDINPIPIAQAIEKEKNILKSKTANARFNSPRSIEGVKSMIEETSGLAVTTLKIQDKNGETKKVKEGSFSSNKKVEINGNVSENDDEMLIRLARENTVITKASEENISLYEKFKDIFKKLIL